MNQYLYEDQFSSAHNFSFKEKPDKTLIIASTPRSGSHFLGHILHQTESFGFPLEYANPVNYEKWRQIYGVKEKAQVITKIMNDRTSENGVFSIKTHYTHLSELGGMKEVSHLFSNVHFVFLTRKNLLKQAISLAIARQTGVWIDGQQPKSDTIVYSTKEIEDSLRKILLYNASWKYALIKSQKPFMELQFEEISSNIPKCVQSIASFMNITLSPHSIPAVPVTKKQSNSINVEWEERFLADSKMDELLDLDYALGEKSKKQKLFDLIRR